MQIHEDVTKYNANQNHIALDLSTAYSQPCGYYKSTKHQTLDFPKVDTAHEYSHASKGIETCFVLGSRSRQYPQTIPCHTIPYNKIPYYTKIYQNIP